MVAVAAAWTRVPANAAEHAPVPTANALVPPFVGINLAGAEFGKLLGVHGRDYLYPTRANVDYYRSLGFNLIRVPFKWERLQHELGGAFDRQEEALLRKTVHFATERGTHVIVDPHNYAKRRLARENWRKDRIIGSAELPISAFADFWSRLAALFRDDPRVILGLMNEPAGIDVRSWLAAANAALAAIRAAGAKNLVLVPGVAYTGAHSWISAGNTAMDGVVDPADHFAFEVHQYFDSDSSGTHPQAVSGTIGSERIEAFQEWARAKNVKAVLGEFNGGRNPASYNALRDICSEMSANPDVWLGWAAWAGGPRWPPDEMFNLQPWPDGREREQTAILAGFARPPSAMAWVDSGATIDLDFARDRHFGAASLFSELAIARATSGRAKWRSGRVETFAPNIVRRTDKGLFIGGAGTNGTPTEHDLVRLVGNLRSIINAPRFTLVVETRALMPASEAREIVSADGRVLLRCTRDGAVETGFGGHLRSHTQPIANWKHKRRVAIASDRLAGHLALGVTGARAVAENKALPKLGTILLGSLRGAVLDGFVTRVTAYREYKAPAALDDLLA
jgi:endoglucanase